MTFQNQTSQTTPEEKEDKAGGQTEPQEDAAQTEADTSEASE